MNCKQAQFLMALFIANDPDLTGQQHTEFQAHLKSCPECARELYPDLLGEDPGWGLKNQPTSGDEEGLKIETVNRRN